MLNLHRRFTGIGDAQDGKQADDVGLGPAAIEEQEHDRRTDEDERNQQHETNTAALGRLAAIERDPPLAQPARLASISVIVLTGVAIGFTPSEGAADGRP